MVGTVRGEKQILEIAELLLGKAKVSVSTKATKLKTCRVGGKTYLVKHVNTAKQMLQILRRKKAEAGLDKAVSLRMFLAHCIEEAKDHAELTAR
jgi:hypothetical protein